MMTPASENVVDIQNGPKLPRGQIRRRRFLLDCHLAGFRRHADSLVWDALRHNQPLDLRRETDNAFDPSAVAVFHDGRKIGYVPRSHSALLARMMDRDRRLTARIGRLEDPAECWEPVRLNVFVDNRLATAAAALSAAG